VKRFAGILVLVILVLIISSEAVLAASDLKDSFVTGDDSDSTTWSPSQIIGQTWTASSSYQLSYLEIYMRRVGNPGNAVLLGRTTTSGNPSSNNSFNLTLPASNVPLVNSWVRFDLPTTLIINISSGSVYWWGIYADGGDQRSNYYAIRFDSDNGYAGGTVKNSLAMAAGTGWDTTPDFDNLFGIFGDALIPPISTTVPTIPPAPTVTGLTATMIPLSTVIIPTPTLIPTPMSPTSESHSPVLLVILGIIAGFLGLVSVVYAITRKPKPIAPAMNSYGINVIGDSRLSCEASSESQSVLQQGNVQIQPNSDPGAQKLVLPKSNAIKFEISLNPVSDPGKQDIGDAGSNLEE
jgi:hypothetical protein